MYARSAKQAIQEEWDKIAPVLLYIVRASFGVALVISIILIFTTILVLLSSTDKSNSRRIFFSSSIILGSAPFNLFYYDVNNPYGRNRYSSRNSSMSFLEAVFSFLLGDGDPNAGLEARRTRAIAQASAPPRPSPATL